MSKKIKIKGIYKIQGKFKKNRKYIKGNIIRYNENKYDKEFLNLMKSGYLEMSDINIELSESFNITDFSLRYKFDDFNEYEKWLCGV